MTDTYLKVKEIQHDVITLRTRLYDCSSAASGKNGQELVRAATTRAGRLMSWVRG